MLHDNTLIFKNLTVLFNLLLKIGRTLNFVANISNTNVSQKASPLNPIKINEKKQEWV